MRLAIGSAEGPRSNVWRIVSNGSDVYISQGKFGNVEKFSLHQSLICRRAFTEKEGPADEKSDRVMQKWKRARATAGQISYGLVVRFPSDHLSTAIKRPTKKTHWLPAAETNRATIVEFVFSDMEKTEFDKMAVAANRTVISSALLPSGETFVVSWTHENWDQESFFFWGFEKKQRYAVAKEDLGRTGRPVRFTLFHDASESKPVIVDEFGAFPAPEGMLFHEPMGSFSFQKVIKRGQIKD